MNTVCILDYGNPENITSAVIKALAVIKASKEESVLIFPENTYHFFMEDSEKRVFHTSNTDSKRFPEKKIAFLLEDMENVTIDGCGSEFIVHGDMMFLCAIRCKNISFKNFSWDYVSPETVEMRTVSVGRNYADFSMPDSQYWRIKGRNMIWFDKSPKTGEIYWERKNVQRACVVCHLDSKNHSLLRANVLESPFLPGRTSIKKLDDRTVRIKYLGKMPRFIREGMTFVLCPNKDRKTAGAFFWESENIETENVHPLYLNGFSWLVQMCKNITFRKCKFVPKKNAQKYITSFADSLHVAGASGFVTVEDCDFSHDLDDPINIHGTFMRVERLLDPHTVKLIYCHEQQGGFNQFHPGDKVAFFSRDDLLGVENEKLYTVRSATDPADGDLMTSEVTFEEMLPSYLDDKILSEGKYVAENVTYTPDVTIKGCCFSYVPTRGILCTTRGKVLIENNEFFGMAMASVYVSNDSNVWYESGPVRDMTIRGNTFYILKTPGNQMKNKGGIFVDPITKGGCLPDWSKPIHKNITIDSNSFYMEHDNVVFARSVENLTVTNNIIKKFDSPDTEKQMRAFRFVACKNVVLSGNELDDGIEAAPEFSAMPKDEIHTI